MTTPSPYAHFVHERTGRKVRARTDTNLYTTLSNDAGWTEVSGDGTPVDEITPSVTEVSFSAPETQSVQVESEAVEPEPIPEPTPEPEPEPTVEPEPPKRNASRAAWAEFLDELEPPILFDDDDGRDDLIRMYDERMGTTDGTD